MRGIGRQGRGRLAMPLIGLALASLLLFTGVATAAPLPQLCRGNLVRDEERPLERMPPEDPPPEGELPFGPRNLSMYRLNFGSRVVLEGSHLGYRFAAKQTGTRILHLNWEAEAVLREVDRNGRVLGTLDSMRRRLGDVEDLDLLQFSFPAERPGLYRFDISFASLRGRELASFDEYFLVVRRRVKLRLAVSARAFRPGETAYARVLNFGTVPVNLRPGLAIDRSEGDKWVRVLRPPVPERQVKDFRWTLAGAEASPCVAFEVPTDATPGTYRFTSSALVFGKFKRKTLAAPFQVRIPG